MHACQVASKEACSEAVRTRLSCKPQVYYTALSDENHVRVDSLDRTKCRSTHTTQYIYNFRHSRPHIRHPDRPSLATTSPTFVRMPFCVCDHIGLSIRSDALAHNEMFAGVEHPCELFKRTKGWQHRAFEVEWKRIRNGFSIGSLESFP